MSTVGERTPLIGPGDYAPRPRRRGVGLVCLLLVMFFQSFGNKLDVYRMSLSRFYNINGKEVQTRFVPFVIVGVVLLYFLPIVIGFYADIIAGRYKSLFFGIGLKLIGSIISFILVLVFESSLVGDDLSPESPVSKALFGVYVVSTIFTLVGVVFLLPTVISFAADQVEQNFKGLSSFVRWCMWTIVVGSGLSSFLIDHNRSYLVDRKDHYYQTIIYGVQFGTDALSIAVFLFGKLQYRILTTEEGEASWKEIVRIIKIHILRSKSVETPRMHGDDIFRSIASRQPELERRRSALDKLRIHKAFWFNALLWGFAFFLTCPLMFRQMLIKSKHAGGGYGGVSYWITSTNLLGFVVGAPVVEIVFRNCGARWGVETPASQLRMFGVGVCACAVGYVCSGVITVVQKEDGANKLNPLLLIPTYVIMGISSFIIISAAIPFVLMSVPAGLSTLVPTILLCLSVLIMAIEFAIGTYGIPVASFAHIGNVSFIFAGIMAGILLLYFLPMAYLYLKKEAAIDDVMDDKTEDGSTYRLTVSSSGSRERSFDRPVGEEFWDQSTIRSHDRSLGV